MSRYGLSFLTGLIVTLGALGGWLAGAAMAQIYPPAVGSLSFTASATVVTPGSPVILTATVLDSQGQPIADTDVLFRIVSQPSNDAALAGGGLEAVTRTNANGIATINLLPGSRQGVIIVEAISAEKSSRLSIDVQGVGAPVGQPPAGLPTTGGGPNQGGKDLPVWLIAVAVVNANILAGSLAFMVRQRRNRQV